MRIIGFLQNYNGVQAGHLYRCLQSMSRCTDEIVVYDDASTEDVKPLYDQFDCDVIYGRKNEFHRELFHKQQLLYAAMLRHPDWILWFDSDAILGRQFEDRERTEAVLESSEAQGIVLLHLHNLNLWRSNGHYRVDNSFNDLWHGVFWKNTGQLHYKPVGRLHQKQYPQFWSDPDVHIINSKFPGDDGKLIHFGFATDEEIARKYFKYRESGQTGWALDRLVTENEERELIAVDPEWMPEWYLNSIHSLEITEPNPEFDPLEMRGYGSYDEWAARKRHEILA